MGVMDRYNDKKKKKEEESKSKTTSGGVADRYERNQYYQTLDTDSVDDNYINSFISDTNRFFGKIGGNSNSNTGAKGMVEELGARYTTPGWIRNSFSAKVEDNNVTFDEARSTIEDLGTRYDTIQGWLYKNRNNLDEETYNNLASSFDGLKSSFDSVKDYYSQFETEDDYAAYLVQEKERLQRLAELTGGYDPAKNQADGKAGWNDYVATQERYAQQNAATESEPNRKTFWDYLAMMGESRDTTLPLHADTNAIAESYQNQELNMKHPDARWTTEQQETFGYLWNTQRQKAYEYAYAINDMLNAQAENAKIEEIQANATNSFGAGAAHTAGALLTAPLGLADYLESLIAAGATEHIPKADGEISPFEYSQAVTGGISQHLNEAGGVLNENIPVIGGKGWGDVYGLGTSIAQSALSAYSGGSGQALVTFFGSAAASGVDDALNRGATNEQAVAYGTMSGLAEALAEHIGVDNLLKIGSSATMRELVWNILKQGAAEGLEEGATTLMNNFADQLVMQDKSNFNILVKQYTDRGMSKSDAKKQAWHDMANDMAFDMLGGFVSGAAHAGPQTTYQTIAANSEMKANYGASQNDLVSEALEIDPGNTFAQRMQGRLDSGKNLSGSQLNRLVQQNEAAMIAQDMSAIQSAAVQRLSELGETGDVQAIGAALAKQAAGEKLSRAERQAITNSKYGQRVANELNTENINSGDYSSAWAENIGTNRINADEYNRIVEAAQLPQEATETTGEQVAAETQNAAQAAQTEPVESPTANDQQVTGKLTGKESLQGAGDGVTRQVSTGNEVTPKKIASVDGGKVMIDTDGGIIAADDIEFGTADNDLLWRGAVSFNGINTSGANGVIHAYRSGQPVATYLQGAAQEFRNGYYSMESGGEYADKLTPWQREVIYDLGQKAAGEHIASEQAAAKNATTTKASDKDTNVPVEPKKVGKVHFERNGRTFDTKRETALKTMEQLSKALGVEFYVYESYVNESGQRVYKDASGNEVHAPNGFYAPKDGSIHIDLNAGTDGKGTMLFTIAHELTHFIRQWSPAKFKVLANFLINQYGEKGASVEELVQRQIAKADKNGRTIDYDTAFEEVVADSMEAIMTDGNVVQMMSELKQQDKNLWQKICDWFKDLVTDLKALLDAYKDVKPDSNEGKMVAQMQDVIVMLEYFYADALADASGNYQAASEVQKNTVQEGSVKYSFAGANSENTDHSALDRAKEMQVQGMDNETIRQETGWFRGMDGKWRYEIDDSKMEIAENLSNYMRLGDMMQHEGLYAAYPDLADIDVVFQGLEAGINGSYNPQFDSINLNYKLKNDPFGLKDALIHELQHAIQNREGFTKGATVENWERKKRQGFDSRRAEDRRKAQETERALRRLQAEEPEFYRDMLELEAMTPNVPRGETDWDTLEKIEDDPIEWKQYDARREELEAKYGDMKVWDTNDLLYQRTRAAQNAGRSGIELYFDTAGEIEARDTANRRTKTQEQRKITPPRLGNEDTVFAEEDSPADAYIPGVVDESEIKANIDAIAQMSTVTKIKSDEFKMGDGRLLQDVTAFFESIGGSVFNERLGDVYLRKRGVRHDLGHGMSDEKATSFAAIPDVLQYGKVAGFVKNKGNKGFDSATVVAPIEIGEVPYMMGVIVHRSNNENRFYVHDVFCIKEEAAPLITGTHEVGETGGTASTISIIRRILDVKRKNVKKLSERDPDLEKVNRVLTKENADLKHDVAYLKELLKLQNQVTGGTKFTKTSVEAAARQLMKYANAKGDKAELAGLLHGLYEHIAKGEELTWDSVKEMAQPAVDWLQSHVNTKKQRSSYAEDVLREIRGTRISLDELQKKEVAYQYGSVNEFRKKAMGSVIVTDQNAISLDSQWHEWAGMYPNIFDSEISSNDMPGALLDAFDTLRNMTDTYDYGYDQELVGQDLLRQVYDSYWNVSTLYTVADKAQKEINRLKFDHAGRMATLKKYHKEQTANLKQEHREALQKVKQAERNRTEKKLQEISERYQESRKNGVENRRKTEMRRKIRRTIMDLNKLLNRGDKKRNVKEDMKDLVATALDTADTLFTDNYSNEDMVRNGVGTEMTEQEAKYMAEARELLNVSAETDPSREGKINYRMGKLKEVFQRERARLNKAKVSEVLGSLADAYLSLENSEQTAVKGAFDENVHQYLLTLKTEVGGTIVKDMSLNQLEDLHKAYTMVLTTVRNANKMFAENLKQTREQLGTQTINEIKQAGGEHGLWLPGEDKINAFSWNNQKPVYAFERIGSPTLTKLFENTRAGEDRWAQDMAEAREYYLDKAKKYKYDSWDLEKQFNFTSTSGIDFSLNLEQVMSLYAYSKREQAHDHLMKGGFVFDGNTEVQVSKMGIRITYLNKTAKAHNVSPEILDQIVSKLTQDQKGFVDEMQDYLSSTMGNKGNAVSMQMYGVKLFNEKYYFPLRSAGQYMERAKEADLKKQQGQISIVNSGFTKATTPKSSNPVVLSGFMDVWADHVNEMSMYHSFVLPMEDFRRVYNYSSPNLETGQSVSVNSVIQDAYGEAATSYIDQLYRDLNGGAVSDPRETPGKALMGKFKKAAVFASMSVVIQQPSAIGRAFALINPKYFIGAKVGNKRHKALWAELKQYAPVAAIKEMGYFDTGIGKSAQDFIKGKEYSTLKEKAAAIFTDGDYRDELLSRAPALADELTWCAIWDAVKRETKAKNPKMDVRSEEFLQLAGKRFTEVITKTQVYDSVLSRSANMRSKGAFMSMWTAFMAEPTTTINMVEDALRKGKRGDKKYAARAMGAVFGSVVLNSLLSSLIYAIRDDDEDETFLEKYAQSFATEILDGINPLTYYPLLKDIWSALQGFDIERSDMSLITSLTEATTKLVQVLSKDTDGMDEADLEAHNKRLADAWWGVVDYVTALAGVPVKNVRRDINGAINMVKTIGEDLNGRDTSWGSLVDKTWDSVKNNIPVVGWLPDKTAADKLYAATVSGDAAYQKRLASSYSTENSLNTAIRKGLRENDSRIWEAAIAWNNNDLDEYMRIAKEIVGEKNFSQDNVVLAIQAEAKVMLDTESESGSTESKAKGYFTAEKFAVAVSQGNRVMADIIKADIIETAQKNGKTEEDAEGSFISTAKSNMKELFFAGEINEIQAVDALITYCDYDQAGAEDTVGEWVFKTEYPELDGQITYTQYKRWQADGKPSGVSIETFTDVAEYRDDGTSDSVKGQDEVAAYINSLPIATAQKDALWCCFWKESTLKNAPWH